MMLSMMTKEIVTCKDSPSRTCACSDFYDPDSPSNAIDYSQLATFVFPKCKDGSNTHSNDQEVLEEAEDDVCTLQDLFIEQEEECSVHLELDFSSEDEDINDLSQQEEELSFDAPLDQCSQISNNSYKFLTYSKSITMYVTLILVWLQWMCNQTILTLSIAILFVVILSIFEHQLRTNISLSNTNAQLQAMILQKKGAIRKS
ncbi:hypothetical protein C9374_002628 [Naegleria lovaniensis]|uniref:Uncharacterized protein n=1 Tax=Naegleria lovaniensis TaxID=51637 RepID=A0AA88GP01_NAELO|nr:uncharacterized protein C9374_002628 [Naegleria lovaniensis]KAG2386182.1 hypothetical protein C9374_002628 [Naegleria lovaniensis]